MKKFITKFEITCFSTVVIWQLIGLFLWIIMGTKIWDNLYLFFMPVVAMELFPIGSWSAGLLSFITLILVLKYLRKHIKNRRYIIIFLYVAFPIIHSILTYGYIISFFTLG